MGAFASGGVGCTVVKVAGACCLSGALLAEPVIAFAHREQQTVYGHVEQVHASEGTSADTIKPAEPITSPRSGGTSEAFNAFLLHAHGIGDVMQARGTDSPHRSFCCLFPPVLVTNVRDGQRRQHAKHVVRRP